MEVAVKVVCLPPAPCRPCSAMVGRRQQWGVDSFVTVTPCAPGRCNWWLRRCAGGPQLLQLMLFAGHVSLAVLPCAAVPAMLGLRTNTNGHGRIEVQLCAVAPTTCNRSRTLCGLLVAAGRAVLRAAGRCSNLLQLKLFRTCFFPPPSAAATDGRRLLAGLFGKLWGAGERLARRCGGCKRAHAGRAAPAWKLCM